MELGERACTTHMGMYYTFRCVAALQICTHPSDVSHSAVVSSQSFQSIGLGLRSKGTYLPYKPLFGIMCVRGSAARCAYM